MSCSIKDHHKSRLHILGALALGKFKVELVKKQSQPGRAGIQKRSCAAVFKVLVIGPDHEQRPTSVSRGGKVHRKLA